MAGHSQTVSERPEPMRVGGRPEAVADSAGMLVHWALSEDIRSMKRVKDALGAGRPMPMALRENRVWGVKEKLFERALPHMGETTLANLLHAAHKVDGIVKGLKQPDWPTDGWQALQRLAGMVCTACSAPAPRSPRVSAGVARP